MNNIRDIRLKEYNYSLPDERIAKYPLERRDESKLLLYRLGNILDKKFNDLPDAIPDDMALIFNNTEVIRSRLFFRKSTGALIEIFCIEPHSPADYEQSLASNTQVDWKCIVGNLKKWKSGPLIMSVKVHDNNLEVKAEKIGSIENDQLVRFTWDDNNISFSEIMEASGHMPVPPYLNRIDEPLDILRYQTVYSKNKGSVAAPTAGLHFTDDVLNRIRSKGISSGNITLHVSAGTFIPVKSETIGGHSMHKEHFVVEKETIELLKKETVLAVGTTSVRTVETLYHLGNKLLNGYIPSNNELSMEQWEVYDDCIQHSKTESMNALLGYMDKAGVTVIHASTSIIIVPGYNFKIVKGLITNFHMPSSTLLLLVSALIGDDWLKVYNHALESNYRFLSYGDSSLLLP